MTTTDPAQRERVRAILISLVGGIAILGLKAAAYYLTGSMALQSDALESIVNVVAAAFGLGALIFAGQPADKDHPYGHGKMEYFAAAFEGGLISLAAVIIFYESALALARGVELKSLGLGLALNMGAGALNGLLGWFLLTTGRRLKSKTLEADGHHVLSDFYTTGGIFAGLMLVQITGYSWLDPVIAIAVAVLLAKTGFGLVRESAAALLDEEDSAMIATIVADLDVLLKKGVDESGVITVHGLRAIRSGRYTHVDVHFVVPEYLPVAEAHDSAERLEKSLIAALGLEGELHVHIDPCRRKCCARCTDSKCPIRVEPLKAAVTLTAEEAVIAEPIE
ncbi:MAG: cation diffusion facilitator family transporter [Elusimicrobia bacterium]|nr:cation diffusion facilitator family transporter [Elusimicrobiota bacterium]